jgi:4-diphosphocytidyl-2-C-methyl-D-erythritol kinase
MRLPISVLAAFAPAKVNLFLHVGGPDAEGYHPISSLMVFADVGDQVMIQPSDAPAFETSGPFGGAISADGDNLVVRAALAFHAKLGGPIPPYRLILDKRLPIAAGLGGGSSDAGAALKLLRDALAPDLSDDGLERLAASLGDQGRRAQAGRAGLAGPTCGAGQSRRPVTDRRGLSRL